MRLNAWITRLCVRESRSSGTRQCACRAGFSEGLRMLTLVRERLQPRGRATVAFACALLGSRRARSGDGGCATGGRQGPDPVVIDFKIAYVKRPVPEMRCGDRRAAPARVPRAVRDLYVRDHASPSAIETQRDRRDHPGPRRRARRRAVVRRHAGRVRDARAADRGRGRGGSADLEHLGVRHRRRSSCGA